MLLADVARSLEEKAGKCLCVRDFSGVEGLHRAAQGLLCDVLRQATVAETAEGKQLQAPGEPLGEIDGNRLVEIGSEMAIHQEYSGRGVTNTTRRVYRGAETGTSG